MKLYPFHSKELPDIQKKLFRRSRGVQATLNPNGNTVIEFIIPYNWCKITTIEVVGLTHMVKVDFSIIDTPVGTYSTVPNYKLNQFGFNVNMSKDYYRDHSEYDADLYLGMVIQLVVKNDTDTTPLIGVNFTLHEVV
jgi:hypothetical protein